MDGHSRRYSRRYSRRIPRLSLLTDRPPYRRSLLLLLPHPYRPLRVRSGVLLRASSSTYPVVLIRILLVSFGVLVFVLVEAIQIK